MSESKQTTDLGILLALAYQGFVDELRAALAARGYDDLGRSDGYVFRLLEAERMSISRIADELEVSKQAAAQIVEDMESRGYVERAPDPADGRARLIRLSARGRRALGAARRFHGEYERQLAARHGRATVTAVREVLSEMATRGRGAAGPRRVRPL